MSARLIYRDGYPTFAPRPTVTRSYGVCDLSAPDSPHEAELHDGICADDWARMVPFDIRERKRWHRQLRLWWVRHSLTVSVGLFLLSWLLVIWQLGALWATVQGVWGW